MGPRANAPQLFILTNVNTNLLTNRYAQGQGGLILPLFGNKENRTWDDSPLGGGLRALLYFLGLMWAFLGVSIIADIFMSAIETITSAEKKLVGTDICVKVLNSVGKKHAKCH